MACFSLLLLQFWFLSIVIACWRYFRDKQTSFIQNNNRVNTCIILHPINQIEVWRDFFLRKMIEISFLG
ncbi:unnamed protein product [Meloidogyne enterolobii]|uniref:Uncharacterized protein n=1 Tax=Meloidogyne enterolobii TaxID=390850 RepID=A0ACB1AHI9_MELEN